MTAQIQATPQSSGLVTVLNVCVSPRNAFSTLREMPMWGWAFIIATVLGIIGSLLAWPATEHVVQTGLAAQTGKKPVLGLALKDVRLGPWVFAPFNVLLVALVQTGVMLIGNAISRGSATFKQSWSAAMNISVVTLKLVRFRGELRVRHQAA